MTIHKRLLILLYSLTIPMQIFSQECECNVHPKTIAGAIDYAMEMPEESPNKIKMMSEEKSSFCKSLGLLMDIRLSLNEDNLDSLELKLASLKNEISKTNCKDSLNLNYYRYYAEYYFLKAKYGNALIYTQKYQQLAGELGDYHVQFNGLRNMAMLLNRIDQPQDGIKYSDKAYNILTKHQTLFSARDIQMLAQNYLWYYQDYDSLRFKQRCDVLIALGTKIAKDASDYTILSRFAAIQAGLMAHSNDYKSALTLAQTAINYSRAAGHKGSSVPNLYRDFASYSFKMGNYNLARKYMDSCYYYYANNNGGPVLGNFLELSYLIEKNAGNHNAALSYLERLTAYKDSVKSVEQMGIINDYEQKYNKAENELEIQKLASEKQQLEQEKKIDNLQIRSLIGIITAAILGLIILFYYFKRLQEKARFKITEIEQRLNRSRMNPHFFFNALTSLQGLAIKENDGKKVALNLYKFSSLMRKTLESSYNDYEYIEQEIEFINQYIELQKLKDPDLFDFEIHVDENIETDLVLIPSMLIQPFLENSIEHGFKNIKHKGLITIELKCDEKNLMIKIKDNGSGMKKTASDNRHISRATQITSDRLHLLKKGKNKNVRFDVTELPEGGVVVNIILPLMFK